MRGKQNGKQYFQRFKCLSAGAQPEDAVDLSKAGESMTLQGIQGKADIQDVVLAVSNAEMALNTVVSVRDTAIKAYNTIISMPI